MESTDTYLLFFVWYVVFVFSVCLHEAAHAWSAMLLGDPTAYHGGQVTLNPVPHIQREPIGMVLAPIVTFFISGWMMGWAHAPLDPFWAMRHPRRSALVSLAGPLANLQLVILSGIAIRVGMHLGYFAPSPGFHFHSIIVAAQPGVADGLAIFLSLFFMLNLLLFIFNLLPAPPLDGASVVMLFMRERFAARYMEFVWHPEYGMIGIVVAWRLMDKVFWPVASPIFRLVLGPF